MLSGPIAARSTAYGHILGGDPPCPAAVLFKHSGCELVALNRTGRTSIELTGLLEVGGIVDLVRVHVLVPLSAAVGDTLAFTTLVDVRDRWPQVKVVSASVVSVVRPVWDTHPCTLRRYWKHRGDQQPAVPTQQEIVWHTGPADTLPPPEAPGHLQRASGRIQCAWCRTKYAGLPDFLAGCAPDSDGTTF